MQTPRTIKHIVLHCTATVQTATPEAILNYWQNTLKWKRAGYHYLIKASGELISMQPENLLSNGVAGHNTHSINVAYIGGIDAAGAPTDNRTLAQKSTLTTLLKQLKTRYPDAQIVGHRDFAGVKKACPCFNAITEYQNITSW